MTGIRKTSFANVKKCEYSSWASFNARYRSVTRLLALFSTRIALSAMGLLSVGAVQAEFIAVDSISFQTTGQSIGLGLESKTFDKTVIDTGPQSKTIGSIDTMTITNPARVVYNGKLASCTALLSNSQCVNGIGPAPPQTIDIPGPIDAPNPAYATWLGFQASCIVLGYSDSVCQSGLGPGPAETIDVRDGAQVTAAASFSTGVFGEITLASPTVDVSYSADVAVELIDLLDAEPDVLDRVSLALTTQNESGTLAGDFSSFELSVSMFAELGHSFDIEVVERGLGILDFFEEKPLSYDEIELINASIDGGAVGAQFLELEALDFSTTVEPFNKDIQIPVPYTFGILKVPVADVTLYPPDFDMDGPSVLDNGTISNSTLPVTRSGTGETPIDFLKFDVDQNVWCSATTATAKAAAGLPFPSPLCLGASGTIKVPKVPLASVTLATFDKDLGFFLGLGQTASFAPNLLANIDFGTEVTIFDGPSSYSASSVTKPVDGLNLDFILPESDLNIDISYSLADNILTNIIDLMFSPSFTFSLYQVQFGGVLLSSLEDFYLFGPNTIGLGDPIPIKNLDQRDVTLGGFSDAAGSNLLISGRGGPGGPVIVLPPTLVPEPGTLLLLGLGLVSMGLARRRRKV